MSNNNESTADEVKTQMTNDELLELLKKLPKVGIAPAGKEE